MADRFYEDLAVALAPCWERGIDDYDDEDEDADEYYEDGQVNDLEKFEKKSADLACPFCSEDYDVLGLCCHIDADHRMEIKSGICPVCAAKVRINMASHVITHHEIILKTLSCTQQRSARSLSAILILRKQMQEKHCIRTQESRSVNVSSDPAADSTLLSFVNNPQLGEGSTLHEATFSSSNETALPAETCNENPSERKRPFVLADWSDERTRRLELVQGLVLSTIFNDL